MLDPVARESEFGKVMFEDPCCGCTLYTYEGAVGYKYMFPCFTTTCDEKGDGEKKVPVLSPIAALNDKPKELRLLSVNPD